MMRLSDWCAPHAAADSVDDSEATSATDERLTADFAVCGCGICEHGTVDEDGLCASCGVWPILVADRASAEEVVGLREDVEAATARAEAAEARAAQAETKAERLRALLSTGLEIVDSLSAGYDVWAEQVRAAVEPGAA